MGSTIAVYRNTRDNKNSTLELPELAFEHIVPLELIQALVGAVSQTKLEVEFAYL